jgi:dihydropteroate synthase
MSTTRRYLRPIGAMPPPAPGVAGETAAIVVAGRDDMAFAAAEVIERDGGRVSRRIASAAEVLSGQVEDLEELVENLRRPRAAIAGLALDRPRIMGIVNVTPDSFADGGRHQTPDAAIAHAL